MDVIVERQRELLGRRQFDPEVLELEARFGAVAGTLV